MRPSSHDGNPRYVGTPPVHPIVHRAFQPRRLDSGGNINESMTKGMLHACQADSTNILPIQTSFGMSNKLPPGL